MARQPDDVLSAEEWIAQAEKHNAVTQDPSDYVDHEVEEFCKAVRGIPTPLGEAILDIAAGVFETKPLDAIYAARS